MSQADGNFGLSPTDAPIFLSTRQDVTIRHVTIAANTADDTHHPETPAIPLLYILLERAYDASGEWYRGHVKADTLTLFGSNSDAILVTGTGEPPIYRSGTSILQPHARPPCLID
jgi:hypothetical protein